ncbi:hypothetical protein RI129_005335 [Pyrocoelia pectoralis]|uniref:Hydrocephalus-inducing protein n=1 Tax=Pyrocoelia pectoralis TaxID=417401 RepID=A0AAN7VJZ2_9COLE
MEEPTNIQPLEKNDSKILNFIRQLVNGQSELVMRPSRFREEMELTTEARINKYKSSVCKSKNSTDFPIFEPIPETIVFQNYQVGVSYSTSLMIRNNGKISRPLRPIFPSSSYLTVTYASESISTHIAPGMALIFNVKFYSEHMRDYQFDLKFLTESETLIVSVYAIKPRPLLDLSDYINLPISIIHIPYEESVYIRNLATVPAIFSLNTQAPFSVKPGKGILNTGDVMRLSVIFQPTCLGKSHGKLFLTYDSGETLSVNLKGYAKEANVYLEKGSIHFDETFAGLTRQKNITLINNSNYLVKFEWKLYGNRKAEVVQLQKLKDSLGYLKENETIKCNKLQHLDIIDADGHSKVYERIYTDELDELESGSQFLYQNPYFRLVPLSGDIWPNAKFTFTIFFAPTCAGKYHSVAFLYVSGRGKRIRLLLNGLAIGPQIELNLTTLDVSQLYICSVHQYEIVARNKGDIPGSIKFIRRQLEFGGTMSCEPLKILLEPSKCGRFMITFSSREQGKFIEEIIFTIEESNEMLRVIFSGEIDCPYLSFDEHEIDFGTVPIGYPVRKPIIMYNTSLVPISYNMFVHGDGNIPSVTCKEYASLPVRCGLSKKPREFDYSRRNGRVSPNSSFEVELTLTANIVRQCTTELIIKMWDSERHTVTLPIMYAVSTPKVVSFPPEINIRFCFLNYPYYSTLTLHNESQLPGYIEIDATSRSERGGIECNLSKTSCFIKPYQDVEINMVITMKITEDDRLPIYMTSLGGRKEKCCSITCHGQGPVVTASNDEVDFGKVTLLEWTSLELIASNDSPIMANCSITISPKSLFVVEPSTFVLNSEESRPLSISVYMTNPVSVVDKFTINVTDGNTYEVILKAKGVGSSIESIPALQPSLNFDVLMTCQEFSFDVTLMNKGKRWHKLYWSRNKHLKQLRESSNELIPSTFTFSPCYVELLAEQNCMVTIKGFKTKPCYVNEDFYCHAVYEKAKQQEIIMSCNIIATFVEPLVELNKTEMSFVKNVGVDYLYQFLDDTLSITNKTPLALSLNLLVNDPFYIGIDETEVSTYSVNLGPEENHKVSIKFYPYVNTNQCYVTREKLMLDYETHPKIDAIDLTGEVNYPNIVIQPNTIAFVVPSGSTACYNILLKNISPLLLHYSFKWQEEFFYFSEVNSEAVSSTLDPSSERTLTLPKENFEFLTEMRSVLHGIVAKCDEVDLGLHAVKTLPPFKQKPHLISRCLSITPGSTTLRSYECSTALVVFQPPPNSYVTAKAICHVAGGPSQILEVRGISTPLSYKIETVNVDLGRQILCEDAEKTVSLKNTCPIPFTFKTDVKELAELPTDIGLTVSPQYGKLNPGESIKLRVTYMPGIPGKFSQSFTLKVGYLSKISATVYGYGEVPQVYLGNRESFCSVSPKITYPAIANITPQYLKSLKNLNYTLRLMSNNIFNEELSKSEARELKKQGWIVISYRDLYPSQMDIDLAVERVILHRHLSKNPGVFLKHTRVHKPATVPEYIVPNYVIDLGYVIVGNQVSHTTNVFNYGPSTTFIKVTSDGGKLILTDVGGVHIESNRFHIEIGRFKGFSFNFHPTPEMYKELDKEFLYEICLDVAHGARIPLSIRATITIPRLKSNTMNLYFGEVRCGDVKKRSLILTNSGFVPCTYTVVIQQKEQKKRWRVDENPVAQKLIFFTLITRDAVDVGCNVILDIYFEPQVDGVVESHLIINIENNPEKMQIGLRGVGKMPQIRISNEVLTFEPVLPYVPMCQKDVTIKNTSTVPIEFYFSDFDLEIDEEEKIVNLLSEYYLTKELVIPPRKAGQGLPKQFREFYEQMLESLHEKLIKSSNAEERHLNSLEDSLVTLCGGKQYNSTKRRNSSRSGNIDVNNKEFTTSLLPKDPEELHVLLKDHLQDFVQHKKTKVDPAAEAIAEYISLADKKQPPQINEGIYLIFHGYETTDYVRASCKAGLELNLPVYNMDRVLIEAIAEGNTLATETIRTIIEDRYKLIVQPEDNNISEMNIYERLQFQINYLLIEQPQLPIPKKDDKKNKKAPEQNSNTFLGIKEDLLLDIIRQKLCSCKTGVIFETLHSIFIKNPVQSVTFLLKAIGNVRYIHCFILSLDYPQNYSFEKNQKEAREETEVLERNTKLSKILELDTEELVNLSPEDYKLYSTYFLKERREQTSRKRETLRKNVQRLCQKANGKKQQKISKNKAPSKSTSAETRASQSAGELNAFGEEFTVGYTFSGPVKDSIDLEKMKTFETFAANVTEILHTLEFWDRRTGTCTKPFTQQTNVSSKGANKSSKASSKLTSTITCTLDDIIVDPVDFSNLTPERKLEILQNGIPCWIIDNSRPDKPVEVLVSTYLRRVSDLLMCKMSLAESLKEHLKETVELRSIVIGGNEKRIKNMSTLFFVRDSSIIPEINPTSSTADAKGKTSRVAAVKNSKPIKGRTKLKSDLNDDKFTTRTVLRPGQSVTYRVIFKPEIVGFYGHTFTLQVVGSQIKYFLTCEGNCEIPKLNMWPESIFPKVLNKRTKKTLYHNCIFLRKGNVFDFGPILMQNTISPNILAIGTEFNFTNISLLPCESSFGVRLKPNSFIVEEETITVPPGTTQILNLKAVPLPVPEILEDELLISIKDNPEIYSINLKSQSAPLSFIIAPKAVRFDRTLLMTIEERTVVFKNQSFVPLAWQFANLQAILKKFAIEPVEGYIEPNSSQNVTIQFQSPVKLIVPDLSIKVEIYDKDYRSPIPIQIDTMHVGAEAIAVSIDCQRTLNLQEVKGQKLNIIPYKMISTGKYGVEFTFSPISKEQDPHYKRNKVLRSYFTVTPLSGILKSQTPFEADFKFLATKPLNVKEAPIYNVTFIDSVFKKFINSFILTVTLKTQFSLFELSPPSEINFGCQLLDIEATQTITLSNCGKFDFDYEVLTLEDILERENPACEEKSKTKTSKTTDKGSKLSKSDKSGKSEMKCNIGTIHLGAFTVTPISGTVKPEEAATILVTARSKQLGKSEEVVVVMVSETEDADKNGRTIKLVVTSFLPTINFTDYNAIFREQFIVNSFTEYEKSGSTDTKPVFVKNQQRLHFPNVPINTKTKARIRLENVSPVPADLECIVKSQSELVFTIDPTRFNIEPYSANYITITFQPNNIGCLTSTLSVQYYGVDPSQTNNFHITLSGEGVVPEIVLTSPKYDAALGFYVINFPPIFINDIVNESIRIENVGSIPCQVICEVCEDASNVFNVVPHQDTKPKLKIQDDVSKATSHTNLVYLNVGEMAEFRLQFQPLASLAYNCIVKIHLINNPYEIRMVAVTGTGYADNLRMKDLVTCVLKKESSLHDTLLEDIIAYTFDFGPLAVNKPYRQYFKIMNTSLTQIYKFEFTYLDKLSFVPTRGHLKPEACKDVIATFKSKEPCTMQKVPFQCNFCQIQYVNPQVEALSWDDRQTVVIWADTVSTSTATTMEQSFVSARSADASSSNSSSIKMIRDKDEPAINITAGSFGSIPMLISATCDYSSFTASVDKIEMPDTFAFERQTDTFEITNTSNVYLEVRWNIVMEENYPIKLATLSSPGEYSSCATVDVKPKLKKTTRPLHLTGSEKFTYNHVTSKRSSESSLFSEESTNSSLYDNYLPFTVTPNHASIAPMEQQTFTIMFAPKGVFEYLANVTSDIVNMNPTLTQLNIKVKAKSLLPVYYFILDPTDYLTNRRNVSITCSDLVNQHTEVVEFEAIGLGVPVESFCRSFYVVNPSEKNLSYKWTEAFPSTSEVSLFYCFKPQGLIERRKKANMTFSFMPPATGTFESFYVFSVDRHSATKTFLMVGHAREPVVFFTSSFIQMRPTVLGLDIIDTTCLKNNEDFEIDFKIIKESIYGDAHQQKLTVTPMKGIVQPHQEKKITITYHPVKVGEICFSLQCVITRMKDPLLVTVSGTCYEIQSQVYYETSEGSKILLHPSNPNSLELKSLSPLLTQYIIFTTTNNGEIGFYYSWILKEDLTSNKVDITFVNGEGFVPGSSEVSTRLCITPLTNVTIKNTIIKLKIRYGPTYTIYLSGATSSPFFSFSVSDYNFGPCLVQKEATDYYKTIINFNNGDDAPITLECKQPEVDFLTIKFKSKQITGRHTEPIEVHFHPFKVQTYTIYVTFHINSRPQELCFRGEGIENSIVLVNFSDKFLNFGEVPVGGTSKRIIYVLNNSNASVDILFDLPYRLPIFARPKKILEPHYENDDKTLKIERSSYCSSEAIQGNPFVTIVPKRFTRVLPHQTTHFIATYDIVETLCTYKGSCVGPEYCLDKNSIPFGCVILGYSNKQKAMLNNIGDVGGAFKWIFEKNHPFFTIAPEQGYVSPNTSAVFTIQFKPASFGSLFETKIKCLISGYRKSLEIQLSGSCIGMPPPVETVNFECPVRGSTKRFIIIENPSAQSWRVTTTITGQYFISKDVFTIKPKSALPCDVSYCPLTMTGEMLHTVSATIFFAYPEGLGRLYELIGETTPPLVVARIERNITCKQLHKEILNVPNWLKNPQAFEVITNNLSPNHILYRLDGNPTIEVLGQSERPYTWSIYVLNEGTLNLKVMFRNKDTLEYLHYEIILKILKSSPLEIITLSTCVRKPLTHIIILENPLSRDVTFNAKSSVPELTCQSPLTIPPLSEKELCVTYYPLNESELDAQMDIISNDLGLYPYDFKLIARPPVPDQQLIFITKLGQIATQKAYVTNSTNVTATLGAQFTDSTAFVLEGSITVTSQETKEFTIRFEPYEIGSTKSSLILQSPVMGTYLFSLSGTCELPKPQGPYFIVPGNSITLTFKNPFMDTTDFRFVAEPAIFSVKNETLTVKARSEAKIAISLVPMKNLEILIDRKYSIAGKLTICPIEEHLTHIKWIYYLQGDLTR